MLYNIIMLKENRGVEKLCKQLIEAKMRVQTTYFHRLITLIIL